MSLIRIPARFWRNTSVQVAGVASCLFVVILVLAGMLVESRLVGSLMTEAKSRAQQTADELVDEFVREGLQGLKESISPRLHGGERRLRYALADQRGEILIGDEGLCRFVAACRADRRFEAAAAEAAAVAPVVISRRLDTGEGTWFIVVVDDVAFVRDIRSIIAQSFWSAVAAAVLAGAAMGYLLSRYLLAQVGAINIAAEAIVSGDLSRRIPTGGTGDEFEEMRRTLNRMLERITDLLRNVHQVSTDIAHDLRTPLSRLRHKLEAAGSHALTPEQLGQTLDAAVHDLDVVLETFSALLRIAQVESGARRAAFTTLDLSAVLADIAETYQAVAEGSGHHFEARIAQGLIMVGDRDLLVQMLSNVIENALVHTSSGSSIDIDASQDGPSLTIAVRDDGPGIAATDQPFVFRRFYRGERSRSTPGTGLGLSLVAAIADLHGGTVDLADANPGLHLKIRFPVTLGAVRSPTAPVPGLERPAVPHDSIQDAAE